MSHWRRTFLIIDEASAVGVGDKVHLSVRPERLLLSDEAAETNSLKGTVLQSIYKGTDISTTVELEVWPDNLRTYFKYSAWN